MTHPKPTRVYSNDADEFRCPDCGARCTIARTVEDLPPGVIHTLPTCATFNRLSVTDFVALVNRRRVS